MPASAPPTPTLLGMPAGTGGAVLVLGAPFDQSPATRTGCAEAPATLRILGDGMSLRSGYLYSHALQGKILEQLSVSDIGDLDPHPAEAVADYLDRLATVVRTTASHRKLLLVLGGDHVVTLAVLRGLLTVPTEIQVVHLDAHSDVQDGGSSCAPTNANFVSFAADMPGIQRWIQVGVRAVGRHVPTFPGNVITSTPQHLAQCLIPGLPVYLTIDTDAFDPSVMPAVRYPVPRGLSFEDFNHVLSAVRCSQCPLIGLDWVEFNPSFELRPGTTAAAILVALVDLLHLLEYQQLNT